MYKIGRLSTPPRILRSMNNLKTPTQPKRITPFPTAPKKNIRFAVPIEEVEEEDERESSPSPPEIQRPLPQSETIDFLADPSQASSSSNSQQGFKVRYNKELRLLSVIDLGQGLSGQSMDKKRASEALNNIKKSHPSVSEKIGKSKFIGSRQKTWACDIDTAIELCQVWPGRTAAEFRRNCAVTIRRVLAGDETLIDEIVENSLRTDTVSQLMQEAATAGPSRQRRNAITPVDPYRSDIWYASRETRSKPRHHVRSQLMKEKFPELKQKDYREWNSKICKTVTGMSPKEFSELTGAKKHNRRDFYNTWGLATQSWLDSTAVEFMENENIKDFKEFKEGFDEIATLMENLGKKKNLFQALPEKPLRKILTAQKALEIENDTDDEKKRKSDNVYQ